MFSGGARDTLRREREEKCWSDAQRSKRSAFATNQPNISEIIDAEYFILEHKQLSVFASRVCVLKIRVFNVRITKRYCRKPSTPITSASLGLTKIYNSFITNYSMKMSFTKAKYLILVSFKASPDERPANVQTAAFRQKASPRQQREDIKKMLSLHLEDNRKKSKTSRLLKH